MGSDCCTRLRPGARRIESCGVAPVSTQELSTLTGLLRSRQFAPEEPGPRSPFTG